MNIIGIKTGGLCNMAQKKRRDECLFCKSRACYERVYTKNGSYDEVACRNHSKDLHLHSDATIPGVLRTFSSSTGKQRRGGVKHMYETA